MTYPTPYQPGQPPPGPTDSRSFLGKLFDVRFASYVTPTVVSVLYVLGMIGIAIGYLTYVVLAFTAEPVLGLLVLFIVGPLASLLFLIWLRVTLEFYLALVRLSGDVREWREEWRRQRTS
jgi:hypothetical protein